ncbi:hydratase [Phaeobacter sp. J2-8]|uniref:hydratase n=1 Tax=Phaeobacter sp. J2-8 TaxID=2931394 RepID=UPI001FD6304B|nr:hydratase [Phaeobacter sp. J2-8]MCJ7874477.1 hydratase [Phaeobacter sp. J2-8]
MSSTDHFATALIDARRTGDRVTPAFEPNYTEALEIQAKVQNAIGEVSGFKVARQEDGPPIMAPIPANATIEPGTSVTTRDQMGIELEIGFELIADYTADALTRPQDFFRPRVMIELVDTRMSGVLAPMQKLADMQLNCGLVVGPALDAWDGSDFGTVTASLRCGDKTIVDGDATVPFGASALTNLALLCDNLGDHCGGLQKGQIVITGSLSGCEFFPAGTDVVGHIAGFGEVSCRLI